MSSVLVFIIGLISVLAGIFAFFDPFAATVGAEQLAAWLFLFVGFMELFASFRAKSTKSLFWTLLFSAILMLLIGFFLLFRPLDGVVDLTILIAVFFLLSGVLKIAYSFMFKGERYFWAHIVSGLISLALAALIFGYFPESAASILGILLSVELIFSGASMMMVSIFFKKQESQNF